MRQGRDSEPGLLGQDASGVRFLQLGGREHGGCLFVERPQVRAHVERLTQPYAWYG